MVFHHDIWSRFPGHLTIKPRSFPDFAGSQGPWGMGSGEPGRAEAPPATGGRVERVRLDDRDRGDGLDEELGDLQALADGEQRRAQVDQDNMDLAAVAGVDDPGQPMDPLERDPALVPDEADVALRNRDLDAGRDGEDLARPENVIDDGIKIEAGVAGVAVDGELRLGMD